MKIIRVVLEGILKVVLHSSLKTVLITRSSIWFLLEEGNVLKLLNWIVSEGSSGRTVRGMVAIKQFLRTKGALFLNFAIITFLKDFKTLKLFWVCLLNFSCYVDNVNLKHILEGWPSCQPAPTIIITCSKVLKFKCT